jgi:predicted Zn-dependent peptidase
VDDPQKSVEEADQLVATAIQRLAEIFAAEKARLEGTWSRGSEVSTQVSTEDMRQALRRYRSFFDRILSV